MSAAACSWRASEPEPIDLATVVEDGVNAARRHGDDGFRVPTTREANQLVVAWRGVLAGRLRQASRLADPLGYEVVQERDVATGEPFVLLAEDTDEHLRWRGWGLYLYAPRATSRLVVEVTHPASDAYTENQGLEAFRQSRGRALLVAGARRDAGDGRSADVAHRPDTLFHRIHQETVSSTSIVYQPHGYANSTYPRYDLVVSTGDRPTPFARLVAKTLEEASFEVCLYDGRSCKKLAATTNIQGTHTRDVAGAEFLHLETSRRIRNDSSQRLLIAKIIAQLTKAARD